MRNQTVITIIYLVFYTFLDSVLGEKDFIENVLEIDVNNISYYHTAFMHKSYINEQENNALDDTAMCTEGCLVIRLVEEPESIPLIQRYAEIFRGEQ